MGLAAGGVGSRADKLNKILRWKLPCNFDRWGPECAGVFGRVFRAKISGLSMTGKRL